MEGKRFSVDVKCEDPVMVYFDVLVIFVSTEHPYGNEFFLERIEQISAGRLWDVNDESI